MDDSAGRGNGNESTDASSLPPADALKELRRLLLVAEEAQVSKLQERLDDPEIHAEDVSRVLPEAIVIRSAKDETFSNRRASAAKLRWAVRAAE